MLNFLERLLTKITDVPYLIKKQNSSAVIDTMQVYSNKVKEPGDSKCANLIVNSSDDVVMMLLCLA